jgi:hypothetical protein
MIIKMLSHNTPAVTTETELIWATKSPGRPKLQERSPLQLPQANNFLYLTGISLLAICGLVYKSLPHFYKKFPSFSLLAIFMTHLCFPLIAQFFSNGICSPLRYKQEVYYLVMLYYLRMNTNGCPHYFTYQWILLEFFCLIFSFQETHFSVRKSK